METTIKPAGAIPGLCYLPQFLSPEEHDALVRQIDGQHWEQSGKMKRLVQQYGYAYNHADQSRRPRRVQSFPDWLTVLAKRLFEKRLFAPLPDQAIINRYAPGEGIGSHVDYTTHFGPTVASISLLSDIVMDFTGPVSLAHPVPFLLERGSAVILSGDARYRWKHGIASRRTDTHGGKTFSRGLRYSITFRTMS